MKSAGDSIDVRVVIDRLYCVWKFLQERVHRFSGVEVTTTRISGIWDFVTTIHYQNACVTVINAEDAESNYLIGERKCRFGTWGVVGTDKISLEPNSDS